MSDRVENLSISHLIFLIKVNRTTIQRTMILIMRNQNTNASPVVRSDCLGIPHRKSLIVAG
uniref:Uncharacterized protein n=1 Tax=Ascaris lumbricoides TaxID=6252 RepID=A0A0M3IRM5_ASCLU